MNTLNERRRWKRVLMIVAITIIAVSLWYTNRLVQKMARDERRDVEIWAKSIHQKANLVKTTEDFFKQLREEERRKVELLAKATRRLVTAKSSEDITFYSEIISSNNTIPVVLTDAEGEIINTKNVDFDVDSVGYLEGSLKEEFTKYPPIVFDFFTGKIGNKRSNNVRFYYYKDSKTFRKLKTYLDELINSFFTEVVINSASVPVIITDSSKTEVIAQGNLQEEDISDSTQLHNTLREMKSENDPIRIDFTGYGISYIFYRDSYLLRQFKYYPYVQIAVIALFILLSYMVFSSARRSEQNQIWAGMAKETAHQLGTPLSSLMAWVEMLKMENVDQETIDEIEKDTHRLNNVTQRFSKIGSSTMLEEENIVPVIYDAIHYLKNRTSKKISYEINVPRDFVISVPMNKYLFQWVIENLCKNAVDALNGEGKIKIDLYEEEKEVIVDVKDTGKGIPRAEIKNVFNPGYTDKKRGWGLGLTLAQRIVEFYHHGKIFVKESAPNKGTTFRIVLHKKPPIEERIHWLKKFFMRKK